MAQWVKALVAMPDNLILVPRTHVMEEGIRPQLVDL